MKANIATTEELVQAKEQIIKEVIKEVAKASEKQLQNLKIELLEAIQLIPKRKNFNPNQKEWIKAYEVRKLLGISNGTLQNMRINGTIEFTRIGGLTFYRYEDIMGMMEANKHKNPLLPKFRGLNN